VPGLAVQMRQLILFLACLCCSQNPAIAQTDYPHSHEPIGSVRQVYDGALLPDIQANTFRNIDRLFSTRTVSRGSTVFPLPQSKKRLPPVSFESRGETYDLFDYVSLNRISGLIAIKDGEIVFETYQLGNSRESRWMSMSIVKSITATLVGAAIKDGYIDSIDDEVTKYVAELKGTAYDGVSIRNLLQMASGVRWNETYTDPASDRRRLLEAQIAQVPGGMLDVMAELPRAAAPGTRWNYSTGETQVVAALVTAATNRTLADYLSAKIWARFGMESDATWWLESPDGIEVGGSGLSATLRDYARFGLFLLNDGVAGGEQVLPDGWVEAASSPQKIGESTVDYGFMLWPVPDAGNTIHDGAFEALGIFGQRVYVNRQENVVIAIWSARPKPLGKSPVDDRDFFAAVCDAVR
jgi:CubicO group peptidase (beta-lactamase class C family)